MENLLSDIKHGCQLLVRNPGFAVVVILALALGIGANTAVFSVMNAVLLKPLPYQDSDHILTMVIGYSLAVVVAGVVLGLIGSLAVTRLMTTMLFDVKAADPATFVFASLLAVGGVASLVPAFRATLVDPVHTLKRE